MENAFVRMARVFEDARHQISTDSDLESVTGANKYGELETQMADAAAAVDGVRGMEFLLANCMAVVDICEQWAPRLLRGLDCAESHKLARLLEESAIMMRKAAKRP